MSFKLMTTDENVLKMYSLPLHGKRIIQATYFRAFIFVWYDACFQTGVFTVNKILFNR